MIHQDEQSFQTEVLRDFRALGWYAAHLSPPTCPGWQDVIALSYPHGLVLELKDFDKRDLNKPFGDLFTQAQFPRYLKQLEEGIGCVWVALYDKREGDESFRYHLKPFFDQSELMVYFKWKLANVLKEDLPFMTSEGMVRFLVQSVDGTSPF